MTNAIISITLALLAAWALTATGGIIALLFLAAILYLAYKRLSLLTFTATFFVLLTAYSVAGDPAGVWKGILWLLFFVLVAFNIHPLRKKVITRPFMKIYRRMLPSMSSTEREALEAGTVWWDGELFTGNPDWSKLLGAKTPRLTAEEQAFLDGPCEELCRMVDDFDITHRRGDMPPEIWAFLKRQGFFAMIIQKKYGGLEFSAYAHSCVLAKLSSRSAVVSSTVAVPTRSAPASCCSITEPKNKKSLSPASRQWRGHTLLRAYRSTRWFGCGLFARHGCHLSWAVAGTGDRWNPPELLQALHHACAGGDRHRSRLQIVRPGKIAR